MPRDLRAALQEKQILICEGAMGTMLQAKGVGDTLCPELWNIEHPEHIRDVHTAYFDAGSDMAITNTFGASRFKLSAGGVDVSRQAELISAAVRIAREAAGDNRYVLGDIGPTGEVLEPYGLLSRDEAVADFARQAKTMADAGADAIIIETMMDLGEMEAALEAAKQACDLPVFVSMTFNPGAEGFRTMFGQSPADCARTLTEQGADVIGTNCSVGIEDMIGIVTEIRSGTDKPIMAQPNAGIPELRDGENVYPATPEQMAARLGELIEAGATVIGGCCGTSPAFIAAFRAACA